MDNFIRHYAIHRFNYNGRAGKGESVYRYIQKSTQKEAVSELLDDLVLKSSYYMRFIKLSDGNAPEEKVLKFFKSKNVEHFRPLLLSVMHAHDAERMNDQIYNNVIQFLHRFYVCFKIVGEENSNKLTDAVRKHAFELEQNYTSGAVDKCITSFRSKLPKFDSFVNSFRNLGWSNHHEFHIDSKHKEKCRLVLEIVEEHCSNRVLNLDVTIEHILLDSDGEANAQIGNLVLLEGDLNGKCDDLPLEKKLPFYLKSGLVCPRRLADRYQGKDFSPSSRTDFLAQLLYNDILDLSFGDQPLGRKSNEHATPSARLLSDTSIEHEVGSIPA